MMPSCPDAASLQRLLDGALPETVQADLSQHLESCASCRVALDKLATDGRSLLGLARDLQQNPTPAEPGLQRVLNEATGADPGDTQTVPRSGKNEELAFLAPSAKPGSLGRLGHYEVLEVLGQGGFGIVVKAFDEMLHRVVAIKIMFLQLAATSPARKRFLREARASAAIRHENVVAIHAVEEQPIPYLVMEYIPGQTLQHKLDQTGPLDVAEVLRLGIQIANGLAAAHGMGLIHRDIKPSNILLENGVEPQVKITDFGLARAADDASLSQSGVIAGTPMYMAPEQAQGEHIDHRADLFSLGSVLYVMCSGRPPFRATTTLGVLKRVAEDTPRPIRAIIPEVPEWVCAIVAKLHAKTPGERFQTAKEVADLLGQHLAHLQQPAQAPRPAPVSAPAVAPSVPIGRFSRLWSGFILFGAFFGASFGMIVGIFGFIFGVVFLPGYCFGWWTGHTAFVVAFAASVIVAMVWAALARHRHRGVSAGALFAMLLATFGFAELTGITRMTSTVVSLLRPDEVDDPPSKLAIVPGTPKPDPVAPLEKPAPLIPLVTFNGPNHLECMVVAPDGKTVASGYQDGHMTIWEVATGKEKLTLKAHKLPVTALAFAPDSQTLLTGSGDWGKAEIAGEVKLWDLSTGQEAADLKWPAGPVRAVAYASDSKTVAAAGHTGLIQLWKSVTGEAIRSQWAHDLAVNGLSFSPDSKTLASCSGDGTIKLWDMIEGNERATLRGQGDEIQAICFSPDGTTLASGSRDHTIWLWDIEKRIPRLILKGHDSWIYHIAFSADSTTLAAGDGNSIVKLWDATTGKELTDVPSRGARVGSAVAFTPKGNILATGVITGTIRVWNVTPLLAPKQSSQARQPAPFVILVKPGQLEHTFATMAEAVADAQNGDTIEIRGDGPFVTEPIVIGKKALTLRAGNGYRPHLRLRPEVIDQPLLSTDADLVLEGMTLEATGQRKEGYPRGVIFSAKAELHIAHCRLLGPDGGSSVAVRTQGVAVCFVQHCILSSGHAGIDFGSTPRKARYLLANNVIHAATHGVFVEQSATNVEDVSLRLRNNTFLSVLPVNFGFDTPLNKILAERPNPKVPGIRLEASGNILDSSWTVFYFAPYDKSLSLEDAVPLLPRLVSFQDDDNLYSITDQSFLNVNRWEEPKPLQAFKTLAQWHQFWGIAKSTSQIGLAQFQGGDLRAKDSTSPGQLVPADFRLAKGSPGKGAGPGGKDLGADVNLVGPGAPYEKWKQTEGYQQWLKDSGQVKAEQPAADLERLQGTWVITSFAVGGSAVPGPVGDTFTIDGDKFTLAPKTELMKGTVKIDPTQKPKALDLDVTEGGKKGVALCIYALEADELQLSFAEPGVKERPTELGSKKGTTHIFVTLKRKKD